MATALDLFRGAGGWSVACQRLGITDIGVEIMREANHTALAAGYTLGWEDVWEPKNIDGYDGLIASPPCQTFSQAGKGAGRQALDAVHALVPLVRELSLERLRANATYRTGDDRTALVLTPLWYAHNMRPEWIALEQVPTVLPVWEMYAKELRDIGYSVWTGNLQAEMYGVPQTRKRAFLLASRAKEAAPPEPTHSRYYPRNPTKLDEGVKPWVSMADALWWTEDGFMVSNYGSGGDASKRGVRLFTDPAPTVTSKIDRNRLYVDEGGANYAEVREPPEWTFNRPSTTIVGTFKPEIVAAPGYRTTVSRQNAPDSVRVTVQEAGVLQSFPADYPWQGAKGKQFLQAGNAVPPLLAEAVLSALV